MLILTLLGTILGNKLLQGIATVSDQNEYQTLKRQKLYLIQLLLLVSPQIRESREAQYKISAVREVAVKLQGIVNLFAYPCTNSSKQLQVHCRHISKETGLALVLIPEKELSPRTQNLLLPIEDKPIVITQFQLTKILQFIEGHLPNRVSEIRTKQKFEYVIQADQYSSKLFYFSDDPVPPLHLRKLAVKYQQRISFYYINKKTTPSLQRIAGGESAVVIQHDYNSLQLKKTVLKLQQVSSQSMLEVQIKRFAKPKRFDRYGKILVQQGVQSVESLADLYQKRLLCKKHSIVVHSNGNQTLFEQLYQLYKDCYCFYRGSFNSTPGLVVLDSSSQPVRQVLGDDLLDTLHNVKMITLEQLTVELAILKHNEHLPFVVVPRNLSHYCSLVQGNKFVRCVVVTFQDWNKVLDRVSQHKINADTALILLKSPFQDSIKLAASPQYLSQIHLVIEHEQMLVKSNQLQKVLVRDVRYERLAEFTLRFDRPCLIFFVGIVSPNHDSVRKIFNRLARETFKDMHIFFASSLCNLQLTRALGLPEETFIATSVAGGFMAGRSLDPVEVQRVAFQVLSGFGKFSAIDNNLFLNENCRKLSKPMELDLGQRQGHVQRVNELGHKSREEWRERMKSLQL